MNFRFKPVVLSMLSSGVLFGGPIAAANPCNPCAVRGRQHLAQKNPCAGKNPCAARK